MEDDGLLQPAEGDSYFLIEPLPEVITSLSRMEQGKPVSIVGIVQHDPENFEASRTAYFEWGEIYQRETLAAGATHLLAGRVISDMYEPDSRWDEVSVTRFPDASAFLQATLSEAVLGSINLRRACMVDSFVLVVEDMDEV
ncbi:MAG: hypothetical protein MUF14_05460 [Hyphomonadaceae bacterium]|jgi:hypothetical protein|nr:hypothetical protein [Hyphomonadaceae bacterium]